MEINDSQIVLIKHEFIEHKLSDARSQFVHSAI